jgi:ATP-grasp domain-containing protein/L-aminoacid ligase-like protein
MTRRIAFVHPSFYVPYVYESALRNEVELVVILPPGEEILHRYEAVLAYETLPLYDDPATAHAELVRLHARWKFDGVMTIRDACMVWTAQAAKKLGLYGIEPEAARAARDKATMRQRFREAGLVTPEFVAISGLAELDRCSHMTFPFIVKPSSGHNSDGVELVHSVEQLRHAVRHVEQLNSDLYHKVSWHDGENFSKVLIEEFIDGPEYVVELFGRDGDVYALNCGYKGQPPGPYFEESVYLCPPRLPAEKILEIQTTAVRGMKALGLRDGPGHCELRLNAKGEPVILEIGARIGGSGCAHLNVEASTGIDFSNLLFCWVTGHMPASIWPPVPDRSGKAASSWILPLGGSGVLQAIDGLDEVRAHPDCERILMFAKLGKRYRPYPDFDGFLAVILGHHADTASGERFFQFLESTIHVRWQV